MSSDKVDVERKKEKAASKIGEASSELRGTARDVNKKLNEASDELAKSARDLEARKMQAHAREDYRSRKEPIRERDERDHSIFGSLGNAMEGVKDKLVGAKDYVAEKAHMTKESAKDKASELGDKASAKAGEIREKADDTVEDIRQDYDETIQQHRARMAEEDREKERERSQEDRGRQYGSRFRAFRSAPQNVQFVDHAGEEPDEAFDYPYPVVRSRYETRPDYTDRDDRLIRVRYEDIARGDRRTMEQYRPAERCSTFDPRRDCEGAYSMEELRKMVRQCAGLHFEAVDAMSKRDLCSAMKKFNSEGR